MTLDLYLIRCQRNALWAVLPLAVFVAFAVIAVLSASNTQATMEHYLALLPLACVLVALTVRLCTNSPDSLQRLIALALALLGMTAFAVAPLRRSGVPFVVTYWSAFVGLVLAAWSVLVAASVPSRPGPSGRPAWWLTASIVGLAGLVPVCVGTVLRIDGGQHLLASLVATPLAPIVFTLATAIGARPMVVISMATAMGAAVGVAIDAHSAPDMASWTTEFALLYALGGVAAHVGARARGLTAVRELDAVPVRLPPVLGGSVIGRVCRVCVGFVAASILFAVAVRGFVERTWSPTSAPPTTRAASMIESIVRVWCPMPEAILDPRTPDGASNAGIELAVGCTPANYRFRGNDSSPHFGDTDHDDCPEFLDPWLNPFVYFRCTDYAAAADGVVYVLRDGTKVKAKPLRDRSTGGFFRPDSFQLFSMGPDGQPGTDDDIHFGK